MKKRNDIRTADPLKDYDSVWDIVKNVISTGNTYVFTPLTPKEDLEKRWFAGYMHTFVAVESNISITANGFRHQKPGLVDIYIMFPGL